MTSLGSELAMRMLNEYAIVPERSYMVKEQSSSAGGNEYISRTNSEYGGHINSGSTNCEVFNVNDYEIIANDSISSAPKMHETLGNLLKLEFGFYCKSCSLIFCFIFSF